MPTPWHPHLVPAQLNKAFTIFFVVEVAIKIAFLGPVAYFWDSYSMFDFAVTCLGLAEMILEVSLSWGRIQSGSSRWGFESGRILCPCTKSR